MTLKNKVAIITGGATGIGRAIATHFAREGAAVVIDYVGKSEHADDLAHAFDVAGAEVVAIAADVSDEAQVEMLVAETIKKFGKLDIMVNNAGIEHRYPFLETPRAEWDRVIAVNLTGPYLCSQHAAKAMVAQGGGGRIVNVSSVHEDLPMPTNSPYCAAKGGLRMLMRTIAVELAPHNITVNNVAPGAIATPMDHAIEHDPTKLDELLAEIPLRRMGTPQDVAEVCAFLASDAASYTTGSTYFVDGGMIRHAGRL
jgi:glucose 1-dehydrogenase